MSDTPENTEALWYVVHTYSGYENRVKATLDLIIENRGLQEMIHEVLVRTETVIEIKDGKRRNVERKVYPGYVLVKMILTDEIWYIVRNTRGVTGFVGPSSTNPVPLTEDELGMMGLDSEWEPVMDYEVGDDIRVINGPLEGFDGKVETINMDKKKVTVLISMFGRETPVELELTQVIKQNYATRQRIAVLRI